jgi:hypothetical protein
VAAREVRSCNLSGIASVASRAFFQLELSPFSAEVPAVVGVVGAAAAALLEEVTAGTLVLGAFRSILAIIAVEKVFWETISMRQVGDLFAVRRLKIASASE